MEDVMFHVAAGAVLCVVKAVYGATFEAAL